MPSTSQEKMPNEIIRIGADFAGALVSGDSIVGANISVVVTNFKTGVVATATIAPTSPSLSGSIITVNVTAGSVGDIYKVTFRTGLTTLSMRFESEMFLIITDNPASELVLVTRDRVKRQLRITETSDDALIDDLLLAASAYFRRRTGRDITLHTYTEELHQPLAGEDNVKLQLNNYPVIQIDRVLITDEIDNTEYDITDSDYFDFLPEGYLWMVQDPYNFACFPWKNLITYKAGYAKVPEDIQQAVLEIVSGAYRSIGREGLLQERVGDYMYRAKTTKDFPESVRREINSEFVEGVITRYINHRIYLIG